MTTRSLHLKESVLDLDRERRCGMPEVIYCEGKTAGQIAEIAAGLYQQHGLAFGTRIDAPKALEVGRLIDATLDYDRVARTFLLGERREPSSAGRVGVIAAGTSDIPVAAEAISTLDAFGVPSDRIADVGVAGMHRLLEREEDLERFDCLIVVAGMEGALPSVVGGMTRIPVIAVPTSVGYGSSFEGLSALLTMLNSCASGITVVNIDNGFGAAAAAIRILRLLGASKGHHE